MEDFREGGPQSSDGAAALCRSELLVAVAEDVEYPLECGVEDAMEVDVEGGLLAAGGKPRDRLLLVVRGPLHDISHGGKGEVDLGEFGAREEGSDVGGAGHARLRVHVIRAQLREQQVHEGTREGGVEGGDVEDEELHAATLVGGKHRGAEGGDERFEESLRRVGWRLEGERGACCLRRAGEACDEPVVRATLAAGVGLASGSSVIASVTAIECRSGNEDDLLPTPRRNESADGSSPLRGGVVLPPTMLPLLLLLLLLAVPPTLLPSAAGSSLPAKTGSSDFDASSRVASISFLELPSASSRVASRGVDDAGFRLGWDSSAASRAAAATAWPAGVSPAPVVAIAAALPVPLAHTEA